jgi:TetR/AcrR family transcriptional repressor of bet genes
MESSRESASNELSEKKDQPHVKQARWRRRPPADRRQSLIDATIRVIGKHGIADCSLERVAAAAGVSHGLIRHHFGGKGALLEAAYQGLADRFLAVLDEAVGNCNGDVLVCLNAYIDLVHDPLSLGEDHALAWFGLWYEARSNPEVHAINRKFQTDYLAYIENLIRLAAREQEVEVDHQRVARSLIALTDGLWQETMIDPDAFGPEVAREICADFLANSFRTNHNA